MRTDETADITARTCNDPHPTRGYICSKRRGHSGMHGTHRPEGGGLEATWPVIHPAPDVLAEPCDHARRSCEEIGCPGPTPDAPVDVKVNPALLQNATLPGRMRAAAEVLAEATDRYDRLAGIDAKLGERGSWDAANLRRMADRWEADDKETAEKDKLARELADAFRSGVDVGGSALDIARVLVDNGWTKTEP